MVDRKLVSDKVEQVIYTGTNQSTEIGYDVLDVFSESQRLVAIRMFNDYDREDDTKVSKRARNARNRLKQSLESKTNQEKS